MPGIKAPGQDKLNAEYFKCHPKLTADVQTVVKSGGGVGARSRFTENKLVLPQFTGNKIGISRFRIFGTNLRNLWYLKVTPKHSLDRCLYNSSASSSTRRKRNPSNNMKRNECMFCDGQAILLITVENTTRHNQNHGSQRIKYYFLIWRRIILKNQGSHLLTSKKRNQNKQFHISWYKNSLVIHESRENHYALITPTLCQSMKWWGDTKWLKQKCHHTSSWNCQVPLSSLPSKIVCKVILKRLSLTVSEALREKQAGFRKGRGCRTEHIFSFRTVSWMAEKFRQRGLLVNFTYVQKCRLMRFNALYE